MFCNIFHGNVIKYSMQLAALKETFVNSFYLLRGDIFFIKYMSFIKIFVLFNKTQRHYYHHGILIDWKLIIARLASRKAKVKYINEERVRRLVEHRMRMKSFFKIFFSFRQIKAPHFHGSISQFQKIWNFLRLERLTVIHVTPENSHELKWTPSP